MVYEPNAVFILLSLEHLHIRITINTVLYLHHIVTNLRRVAMEEETRMLTSQLPYKGSSGPGS